MIAVMRKRFKPTLITVFAAVFLSLHSHAADPVPLTCVHAHNDYEHKHPLFDALDQGFCSVEADIHLVDGKLLVAHDLREVNPRLTLQSLYLDPLRQRVKKNGGRVYKNGPECTLLIDFKTSDKVPGDVMYPILRDVLKKYADILSVFRDGKKETNAVVVILTGDYPRAMLTADSVRYAAGDGKIADLDTNPPANLVPWISENWSELFKWGVNNSLPADQLKKFRSIIRRAHAQGRQVRFWGSPDRPAFWKFLLDEKVDLVNTDHLPEFKEFYLNYSKTH